MRQEPPNETARIGAADPRRPAGTAAVPGPPGFVRGWLDALAVVAAGFAAMAAVAALGLWLADADRLPAGSFPSVLAAVLALAVGGSVQLDGGAGFFAEVDAGITAMPLTVSLVGALATVEVFLRQLRFRAVAHGTELLGRILRIAVLWLVALALITAAARRTFVVQLGNELVDTLGTALGLTPEIGFHADPATTLGLGLLWLLVVLALAFAVSRRAPLPPTLLPYQQAVRPAASALLAVLLAYVLIGLVAGLVAAGVRGNARETVAVLLLALPNLAWLGFGVGLGAEWQGHLSGAIGLPMPPVLSEVLRTEDGREVTVSLGTLAEQDARAWWLLPVAAVLMLGAGVLAARRSPYGLPLWRHAVRVGLAAAVAMLLVGVWSRVSADYGLSVLGVGTGEDEGELADLLGLLPGGNTATGLANGSLSLQPRLLLAVPLAAGWGLLAGLVGGALAGRSGPRGEVPPADRQP
ncbi:streptophobe family protein [Kitasatospora sp. NPDC054939]